MNPPVDTQKSLKEVKCATNYKGLSLAEDITQPSPTELAQVSKHVTCLREEPNSNLVQDTGYSEREFLRICKQVP